MKKFFAAVLLLALLVTLLVGCKASGEDVLTVATSPDFAPMVFCDVSRSGQDQYVGFDIFLAQYLAQAMGKELKILPMSFNTCPAAVSAGKADMAISGFSWTAERAKNYNLSDYYYAGENEAEQVLVTLAENADRYATADALAGQKIGAQDASLQQALCLEQLPDSEIVPIGDLSTAIMQLRKGDFVCIAVAKGQAEVFMQSNSDLVLSGFSFVVDPSSVGNVVVLKKGDDALTQQVNALLAQAQSEGLYEQWYAQALELAASDSAQDVSYDADGNVEGNSSLLANLWGLLQKYWRVFLIQGVGNTLALTAIAVLLGALLGAGVTLVRRSRLRLVRFVAGLYVEIIRGTPILLQLTVFYFVIPGLLPFLNLSAFFWVAIALCMNSSAYISEVFRSGIQAVDRGQSEAARCLGMSRGQTMLRIVLPQAMRNILPALGNEFIMLLKETSLASTFYIGDLMTAYKTVSGETYLHLEPLLIVGLIYLCMTWPLSKLVAYVERRMARGTK